MSLRDELLAADTSDIKKVPGIKLKSGDVYVRTLVAEDADKIGELILKKISPAVAYTIISAVDKDGKRLFTEEDAEAMKTKMHLRVIRQISDTAVKFNSLGKNELEDQEKNS